MQEPVLASLAWVRSGVLESAQTGPSNKSQLLGFQDFCELAVKHKLLLRVELRKLKINYIENKSNYFLITTVYYSCFCWLLMYIVSVGWKYYVMGFYASLPNSVQWCHIDTLEIT